MGELMDKRLIEVGVEADSWEEIISYGSELLLKKGNVKEGYKEKVIERERQFPTGLAGKHMGIAIPHTSADYTLKPSVCVLIPQKPIAFHAMASEADTIDVSIVIQLAVKNGDMQLEMLRRVAQILQDEVLLDHLMEAKDKQEVIRLLSPILEDK